MPDDPGDRSNDPFFAELAAGLDPQGPHPATTGSVAVDDGGMAIRRDAELIVVQAWGSGPAGVAYLELDHGITVVVDAALPHRVVGATVVPADVTALRKLDPFLGTRAVDALVDTGETGGEWRSIRVRPRETADSVAIGRYVLLADEAVRYRHAYPDPVCRAAFVIELAGTAPCPLAPLLGDRLLTWARAAGEIVVELQDTGRLNVRSGAAARRLASAVREVEATIDRVCGQGTNPLADRRFARQLPPLADRIEEGRFLVDAGDPDDDRPRSAGLEPELDAPPAELGRAACRCERQGDKDGAERWWNACADRWEEADDPDRARAARLFVTGALGNAYPLAGPPTTDPSREGLIRVRSQRSSPARFGWLRRDRDDDLGEPVIRRSEHAVAPTEAVDRFHLLAPFLADDLA
jgi:hypothetical protein